VLPALLVSLAAIADSHGSRSIAFDILLCAVPFAAVAALGSFGRFLETREDPAIQLQALLSGLVVALLVVSCMVRSTALDSVPPLAVTAVLASIVLYAVKAIVAAAPFARRLVQLRPAKP